MQEASAKGWRAGGWLGAALAAAAMFLGPAQAQQTPAPQEAVLVVHAGKLLDKPGQAPRGASTILIRGERIAEVRNGHVAPEAMGAPGASVVDLRSQFVMPGLIDSHVHIFNDDDKLQARLQENNRDHEDILLIGIGNARRTVEAGFTTIRDLGSDPHAITALRDGIAKGLVAGPTILAAGRGISVTGGHGDGANNTNRNRVEQIRGEYYTKCDGPEACRRAVREQISMGADVIKFPATGGVMSNVGAGLERQMFDDEMKAIVETAHLMGRKVAAHAHGKEGIKAALLAGVDSIEHGTYTDDETNALFKKTGAYLVPTMLAPRAALAQARAGVTNPNTLAKAEEVNRFADANWARAVRAGVKIAFGTDNGVGAHGTNGQEFKLMVDAGMSPTDALKAATVNAAELLGRADRIGTIEAGKDADLVAVGGDPLRDITEMQRVQFVMRRGAVIKLDGKRQAFPPN